MSKQRKPGEQQQPDSADPNSAGTNSDKTEPQDTASHSPAVEPAPSTDGSESPQPVVSITIAQYISLAILLAVVVLVGFLFYEVMVSFIVPLFLAAVLVVVFRPLHRWFQKKCGGRDKIAAGLTTTAILLFLLIPLTALFLMALVEGRNMVAQFNTSKLLDSAQNIRNKLHLTMPSAAILRNIDAALGQLQETGLIDDSEYDRHQSLLYQVQESARTLGEENNLAWVDADDTESPAAAGDPNETPEVAPASPWVAFITAVQTARRLHETLAPITYGDQSTESRQRRIEQTTRYRQQILETASDFAKFKTQLLGGKIRATIIEFANPSAQDMEAYVMSGVKSLRDQLLKIGGGAASFVGSSILGILIMVVGLYFFLLDGPKMIESFKGLSPLEDEHESELVDEFARISRAVVVATLLSALVQGLLAGIGFYFVGLESVFLLTVLSAVLAMVPFVGAAAVWIPCCLYLYFVDNNLTAAIGLAAYGTLVISMADNVIKPLVLHGQSNLHPLLALLSVLGGVATLGPVGILVGPMVVAFLQTLLKILQQEISIMDNGETIAETSGS